MNMQLSGVSPELLGAGVRITYSHELVFPHIQHAEPGQSV